MYHNVQYIRTRGVGLGEGPMVSNYVTAFSCNKGTNFDLEEHIILLLATMSPQAW